MAAIFYVMAFILLASGVGVIAFKNPLYSALCLITNLLLVAGLFASLDAHFLATVQIIVYAGAIMVLVVFVLMLLNLKVEQPKRMRWVMVALSGFVGLGFIAIVVRVIQDAFRVFPEASSSLNGSAAAMGEILYTRYIFPFEAASVLIMAALVGAVMLSKKKRVRGEIGEVRA